jgi:tetratricopeptide (TPR) repeat protein
VLARIFKRKFGLCISKWAVATLFSGGLCQTVPAIDLPPLKLMSPLSSVSLDSLAAEADSAYSNGQFKVAEVSFRSILELDPSNRRAMFRLGNIYQQLGKNGQAIESYQQASQATEFSQQLDELGEKALINIALLASEQMKSALAELENRKSSVKPLPIAQSLADELSDSQALIAAQVASRVAAVNKRSTPKKNQVSAVEEPTEVINGGHNLGSHNHGSQKHALKAPPRVTYSQQANPSADAPEITYVKGIPAKEPVPRIVKDKTTTRTIYKKTVKRRATVRTQTL